MFRVHVLDRTGEPTSSLTIGTDPVYLGRAPTNDLVLEQPSISGRHLAVWVAQGQIWVEDLGSRNGSFRANGQRIRTQTRMKDGDELRLGTDVRIRLEGRDTNRADSPVVLVCDVEGSAAYPVRGNRFVLGDADGADVHVDDAPTVTLILHPTGEVWLGTDDDEAPIAFGEPFSVGPRRFVVKGSSARLTATWDVDRDRYPYTLTAGIDGPRGPIARLIDPGADRTHEVTAENRATLLYLLVRQLVNDRSTEQPATHEGWVSDAELASGIWGKAGAHRNLNVLVTRVRSELRSAGFNPWFIEKRKGHTRVQLQDAALDDSRE